MKQRKVQQVGNSTYTVSLPKQWAKAVDIQAGNVVTLRTHIDGLLVVQATDSADDETVSVSIDTDETAPLERLLRATYAAGIDSVRFTPQETFSTDQKQGIKRVAQNLCGLTIRNESDTELTVETLLDPGEVSIKQSVRQLMYITLSAHEDAVGVVTGPREMDGQTTQDDHADRMDTLVDRHFQRALVRLEEVDALGLTRPELFDCWQTARELERVADHAERIATIGTGVDGVDSQIESRLADVAGQSRSLVESSVETVLSDTDVTSAQEALRERDGVLAEIKTCRRQLSETEDPRLQLVRVLDSIERTTEHAGNIAEIGLKRAVGDRYYRRADD